MKEVVVLGRCYRLDRCARSLFGGVESQLAKIDGCPEVGGVTIFWGMSECC